MSTSRNLDRTVALGLVVGWVFLAASARWTWRFILGGHS